jgi:hypothetical protein
MGGQVPLIGVKCEIVVFAVGKRPTTATKLVHWESPGQFLRHVRRCCYPTLRGWTPVPSWRLVRRNRLNHNVPLTEGTRLPYEARPPPQAQQQSQSLQHFLLATGRQSRIRQLFFVWMCVCYPSEWDAPSRFSFSMIDFDGMTTTILIVLVIVKNPRTTLAWCLHNPWVPGKHPEREQLLWQETGRNTQLLAATNWLTGRVLVLLRPWGHFNGLHYHGQSKCRESAVHVNDRGHHHVQACHSATHLSNVFDFPVTIKQGWDLAILGRIFPAK